MFRPVVACCGLPQLAASCSPLWPATAGHGGAAGDQRIYEVGNERCKIGHVSAAVITATRRPVLARIGNRKEV
jgi:hypothetical protein